MTLAVKEVMEHETVAIVSIHALDPSIEQSAE
jgi:hypothetical protein